MSLTTEAQHLIDSLEAHLNAVKAAVVSADAALIAHVDAVWDEARSAIENFRAKLDGALSPAASTGGEAAGSGAAEASVTVSNEITGEGASALTQESQPGAETAA